MPRWHPASTEIIWCNGNTVVWLVEPFSLDPSAYTITSLSEVNMSGEVSVQLPFSLSLSPSLNIAPCLPVFKRWYWGNSKVVSVTRKGKKRRMGAMLSGWECIAVGLVNSLTQSCPGSSSSPDGYLMCAGRTDQDTPDSLFLSVCLRGIHPAVCCILCSK